MTSAATIAGPTVFINQGHRILALDRFTGRERWTYLDRHRLAATGPDGDQALDMNFISVQGSSLVTLTGHASADDRTGDGKVLCLDARDGSWRWSRSLDRIGGDEEQEGLFPHGQPIIAEGAVFVLGRKVTKQYLTTCYVIALDEETGELLWARHLASSGGLRRSARALSTLVYDRGDLYVATAVGAIARLDADTGQTRWLRKYNVPISPRFQDENRRPWELPGPVIARDMVIALQPGQRRVVVLDRDTGHELASYESDKRSWGTPRFLLANDHSLYAIGREIRAFRLDSLEQPVWRIPRPPQSDVEDEPVLPGAPVVPDFRIEIRGRVQLSDGALIIPTLDGVLVVDDETGLINHQLRVRTVGNPVATDAQLLLAGSDRLDSFMSFRRAERMLRERIAAAPEDPEPSLSLLRLGARARKLDLALEAADLALNAIGHDPANSNARQELFSLLLEIDASGAAETLAQGRSLHAMIGVVAIEPDQRVEHLLAHGGWLASHSLAEAVEQYQEVLSDPQLARLRRSESSLVHPARFWAGQRLGELIRRHGEVIYAPQADFAEVRLDQMLRQTATAEQLLQLAAEFPYAAAAEEATVRAAEMLEERGDERAAFAALLNVYQQAPGPRSARRLLGRAAELSVEA
ncbi:MAG: outer membrane protein assembly factor BamB family protein, partial [Planctomycetota bacterium]